MPIQHTSSSQANTPQTYRRHQSTSTASILQSLSTANSQTPHHGRTRIENLESVRTAISLSDTTEISSDSLESEGTISVNIHSEPPDTGELVSESENSLLGEDRIDEAQDYESDDEKIASFIIRYASPI